MLVAHIATNIISTFISIVFRSYNYILPCNRLRHLKNIKNKVSGKFLTPLIFVVTSIFLKCLPKVDRQLYLPNKFTRSLVLCGGVDSCDS